MCIRDRNKEFISVDPSITTDLKAVEGLKKYISYFRFNLSLDNDMAIMFYMVGSFVKAKGRFFGVEFSDGEICIKVLDSVCLLYTSGFSTSIAGGISSSSPENWDGHTAST